jgi:hypothetical protein
MGPKPSASSRRAIRENLEALIEERKNVGWQYHTELRLESRLPLIAGRLFRVVGVRGWFKFFEARTSPEGIVELDCFGPCDKDGSPSKSGGQFRTFTSDRVRSVAREVVPPRVKEGVQ